MKILSGPGAGLLSLTLSSTVLLSGCNSNSSDSAVAPPTRTVLVYMVGSDLESGGGAASADLAEMMKVGSANGFNIVVETGGANKDGWKTVKRRLITAGGVKELGDLGSKNMGDQATLQDFVSWGMKTYPADNYSLVFWDHGGGAVGSNGPTVGFDEVHGDGLSLPEIDGALQNSVTLSGKRFDFVGFDTCLMATVETAKIIARHADYMVASEETEPGSGWDYTAWMGALKANPAMSTLSIGKTIVDAYFASFPNTDPQGRQITLATIQLNKIAAVTGAVQTLALKVHNRLVSAPDATRIEVATGRSRTESYGKQHGDDAGMVDLNDFVSRLPNTYVTEANAVKAALADAVVYARHADERPKAAGLSIYLPSETTIRGNLSGAMVAYKLVGYNTAWETLVEDYAAAAKNDTTAPTVSGETLVGGNTMVATVGGNDINGVNVYLTSPMGDGTLLVLSRESADSYSSFTGQASYQFTNQVLTFNGHLMYTEILDEDEDNGIVTLGAPVMVNNKQGIAVVQVTSDGTTYHFAVLGVIPESADGLVSRVDTINPGDVVTPLFLRYDPSTGATDLVTTGDKFTVPAGGVTAGAGQLPNGSYEGYFAVEDYAGNETYSAAYPLNVP